MRFNAPYSFKEPAQAQPALIRLFVACSCDFARARLRVDSSPRLHKDTHADETCSMASTRQNTSPLLSLPDELLVLIVEQALAQTGTAANLIETCRRLARIAKKQHYARISYGGHAYRARKPIELMESRPDLRELVGDLTIAPVFDQGGHLSGDEDTGYPGDSRALGNFPALRIYASTELRRTGSPESSTRHLIISFRLSST